MPAFLKQSWSNTRSMLCAIWENNLETFEKLLYVIESGHSIYSHFLKPLHSEIFMNFGTKHFTLFFCKSQ